MQDQLTVYLPSSLPHHLAVTAVETILEQRPAPRHAPSHAPARAPAPSPFPARQSVLGLAGEGESQCDSGVWSESARSGAEPEVDKYGSIMQRLDTATQLIRKTHLKYNSSESRIKQIADFITSAAGHCIAFCHHCF